MSIASDVIASEVIDWDEAMEQCGDDEEFLRELLADLRDETDTQVAKIEETIRVSRSWLVELVYEPLHTSIHP
jgi:hypothetical protein